MKNSNGILTEMGKAVVLTVLLGAALLTLIALGACRVPPTGTVSKVVSCTTEAVQKNWPRAIGPVNDCLTRPEGADWARCLDLVPAAVNVTVDVVACVVRDRAASFARASDLNPDDVRSARAARRAKNYLAGVTFAEAP